MIPQSPASKKNCFDHSSQDHDGAAFRINSNVKLQMLATAFGTSGAQRRPRREHIPVQEEPEFGNTPVKTLFRYLNPETPGQRLPGGWSKH